MAVPSSALVRTRDCQYILTYSAAFEARTPASRVNRAADPAVDHLCGGQTLYGLTKSVGNYGKSGLRQVQVVSCQY